MFTGGDAAATTASPYNLSADVISWRKFHHEINYRSLVGGAVEEAFPRFSWAQRLILPPAVWIFRNIEAIFTLTTISMSNTQA